MSYGYVATSKKGQLQRGYSDLASRDAVIQDLERQGLIVISVEEAKLAQSVAKFGLALFGTIRHVEKVLLTKHLTVMLKAGLSLLESLRTLEDQATGWRFRAILRRLGDAVERGTPLSDALAQFPRVFSAFYVNIVRAGEVSGLLAQNLDHLSIQLSKEHELRIKVRSALLYPTVVLTAALIIGFFFAIYVLPQVANLFVGLKGIKLPFLTVVLLKAANFFRKYTAASFFGILGSVFFVVWLLRRRFLAPFTHYVVLRLPLVGFIVKDVNLSRFSLVLGTLLKSGLPIVQAIQVSSDVLDNHYYKKSLARALRRIQEGEPLSVALAADHALFPKIISRMINVGERSGKLEEVLGFLDEFYALEVDTAMKNLSNTIEPALLIVIGLFAMGLAFAIIIPIYNFIGAISRL